MGYKNKKYQKDLTQQINDRLTMMLHSGEGTSKKEAIANGTERDKIFSYSTYESYFKHCKYFSRYVRENHPEVKNLKQAKKYINAWLQSRVNNGYSAWSIMLERQALCKLYGIKPDDKDFFPAPQRHRADIVRSRGDAVRDHNFSEKKNQDFVNFCKGTGCRRNIMKKLEGRDLKTRAEIDREIAFLEAQTRTEAEEKHLNVLKDSVKCFPDQDYFLHHRKDKGGRERYSPIIGDNKQQIVDRMKATASHEKVWKHVSGNADIHGYRGEYAVAIYKLYERREIPYDRINKGTGRKFQGDVYFCRKDKAGVKLDRAAMLKASKGLGHNRIDVIANNYLSLLI